MMKFYTSVVRYGNNILFRGYRNDGKKVQAKIPFKPTLYVQSNRRESGWKGIDGALVEPMKFDTMREATDFMKRYEGVDNFKIYGMNNYVTQFITEEFPNDIEFNREWIDTCTIDIEVASDDGFPEPKYADKPVISITLKQPNQPYRVWGLYDYSAGEDVIYEKCEGDAQLLMKFLDH